MVVRKEQKMRRLIVGLVLAGLLAGGAWAQTITLRAADNQPDDYPTVQGLYFMAEYLRAATGGRIQMEVYSGGQLGDERSTIEQVQLGVLDIVRTSTSPVGEFYPPMGVYSLPFIFRSETHFWKVVQGPIGKELLDGLQQAGMVGLAYYDSGSRNFYTTQRPIRSVADLRGLRIRTQQSQVVLDMMEVLGADAVPMAARSTARSRPVSSTVPRTTSPRMDRSACATSRSHPTSRSTNTRACPRW
jgi:TRAP-type C4-dicarboxylate transport system substrate-binding protein